MRVAIVTGAAQGIGRRTAEILAGAGYAVALLDMQPCTATLEAVRTLGAEAMEAVCVARGYRAGDPVSRRASA